MTYKKILLCFLCLCVPGYHSLAQVKNTKHYGLDQLTWQNYEDILYFPHLYNSSTLAKEMDYAVQIFEVKPDSAIPLLHEVAKKSILINDDNRVALALLKLSTHYVLRGEYDLAKYYSIKGLPYAERGINDKALLANFYSVCGHPYYHSNRIDSLVYWTYKAENEIQNFRPATLEQSLNVARVYTTLCGLWGKMNDQHTALKYAKKALETLDSFKNETTLCRTVSQYYSNVAIFYSKLGFHDSAFHLFDKALAINADNLGALAGKAELYISNSHPEMAVSLLQKAILLSQKNDRPQDLIWSLFHLGQAYDLMKNSKSEFFLKKAITESSRIGFISSEISEAYRILSSTYFSRQMFAEAYDFLAKAIQVQDSLQKNSSRDAAMALEIRSQTALKDMQLAHKQLTLDIKESQIHQKNIWIGAIAIGSILVIALLVALYRANLHKQRLREETINSMMQEREISNLKSIMKGEEAERTRLARELHDGIMVQLSTVMMNLDTLPEPYRRTTTQDYFSSPYYRQIITQLSNATRELRQTAHNLMPDMLLDGGLPEALFYFCTALEKNSGLQISFQQHGEFPRLQPEFEIAVYRIVQELLQNVLKHAKATKTIVQLAHPADELLTITVEDNGSGMTMDNVSGTTGMGLKSIRTRIRALNGNMEILSSAEKGTTVYLEFDITPAMKKNETVAVSDYQ